jgi:hypothetical protein
VPAGSVVDLEAVTRDRYGRVVGVLHARGVRVNVEMVRQGFAAVYEKYCAEPAYYDAREEARAAGRGIWAVPGQQQRPWEWRHRGAEFIPLPKPTSGRNVTENGTSSDFVPASSTGHRHTPASITAKKVSDFRQPFSWQQYVWLVEALPEEQPPSSD